MLLLLMGYGTPSGPVVEFDFTRPRVMFEDAKLLIVEAAKRIEVEDYKTVRFP